jgi:hypothetical protein
MFESFSVDVQAYVFSLVVGITAPLLLFGMLRMPLRHFLHAIFYSAAIERFWLRVVFLAMLIGSLSTAVGYSPADLADEDFIVLIWNLADQVQSILQTLLFSMIALFLPLLLSYTILHVRLRGREPTEDNEES